MFDTEAKKQARDQKRIEAINSKVRHDLITAFSGKGKRGLFQWLKLGDFLLPLTGDDAVYRYNDRCTIIQAMIGPDNAERFLAGVCDVIMEMSREK